MVGDDVVYEVDDVCGGAQGHGMMCVSLQTLTIGPPLTQYYHESFLWVLYCLSGGFGW